MEHKQTYERVVPRLCVGKYLAIRISVYLGYACFAALWIAPIIRSLFSPVLIVLAVLLTATLVLLTKNFLHVEYEYTFVTDTLTVAKIFGKSRRKTMLTLELKQARLVTVADEDGLREIERLSPQKELDVRASPESEQALAIVYDEGKDTRALLLMESDERTVAFFRRHAPQACSHTLRSNLR